MCDHLWALCQSCKTSSETWHIQPEVGGYLEFELQYVPGRLKTFNDFSRNTEFRGLHNFFVFFFQERDTYQYYPIEVMCQRLSHRFLCCTISIASIAFDFIIKYQYSGCHQRHDINLLRLANCMVGRCKKTHFMFPRIVSLFCWTETITLELEC